MAFVSEPQRIEPGIEWRVQMVMKPDAGSGMARNTGGVPYPSPGFRPGFLGIELGRTFGKRGGLPFAAALQAFDDLLQLGHAGFELRDPRVAWVHGIGSFGRIVHDGARYNIKKQKARIFWRYSITSRVPRGGSLDIAMHGHQARRVLPQHRELFTSSLDGTWPPTSFRAGISPPRFVLFVDPTRRPQRLES